MSRGILGGKQVTKFVNMSSYIAVEFVYFFKSQGRFNSHAKSTVLVSTSLRHYDLLSVHLRSLLHLEK